MARGRKIGQLPQRGNDSLHLDDKLPLVDSSGTAHHTSLQSIKDLIGGSGGSSGVLVIKSEQRTDWDFQDVTHFAVLVDASTDVVTCTLPTPSLGKHFVFKKIDSSENNVVIKTFAGQLPPSFGDPGFPAPLIDNSNTQTLFQQYESLTLISDGDNWFIL